MKFFLRSFLFVILCLSLTLAVVAQEPGGTFRTSMQAGCELPTLSTSCGMRLEALVLQPLAALKWTGDELQPLLAESWESDEAGQVWTIHLREGINWHDGEPFDADDVVFTYNIYTDPLVGSRHNINLIDVQGYDEFVAGEADNLSGVVKVDDYTVEITLKAPAPLWMMLMQSKIVILPEHLLSDIPKGELLTAPYWYDRVGIGPFKWVNYEPDQFIELERNEDYFLGAPLLDRVIFQLYADASAHLNALENGEIDEIAFETLLLPINEADRFANHPDITVKADQDAGLPAFLLLNLEQPYFQDVRVREAMMYAIDRQTIVEELWQNSARVANTMFPMEWVWPEDLNPYPYDPELARQLLAEAGWDSSQELDLVYTYPDALSADLIVAIQSYLADVGINVVPRRIDTATQGQMFNDGSFVMAYAANGQGLDPSLGNGLNACGGRLSFGYCNEEIEELFTLGQTTADRAERAPYYQEIARTLNQELPKIWLWFQSRPIAFSNRIVGLSEHWLETPVLMFGIPVYNEIETWYVQE
jgi:peptide/nickel transport system substrate-binding protein